MRWGCVTSRRRPCASLFGNPCVHVSRWSPARGNLQIVHVLCGPSPSSPFHTPTDQPINQPAVSSLLGKGGEGCECHGGNSSLVVEEGWRTTHKVQVGMVSSRSIYLPSGRIHSVLAAVDDCAESREFLKEAKVMSRGQACMRCLNPHSAGDGEFRIPHREGGEKRKNEGPIAGLQSTRRRAVTCRFWL